MIKKENGKFVVYSESGKKFGTYNTEVAAKKRIRQMEMFKHMKKHGMFITPDAAKKLKTVVDNSITKQLKNNPQSEHGILESAKSFVSKIILSPAAEGKPVITKDKAKKVFKVLKESATTVGNGLIGK